MKVITASSSSSSSSRTFAFVGTSLVCGQWKVRLGNDISQRLKIQAMNGFLHPSYVELDEPKTAVAAVVELLGFAEYFTDEFAAERKTALESYLTKRGVALPANPTPVAEEPAAEEQPEEPEVQEPAAEAPAEEPVQEPTEADTVAQTETPKQGRKHGRRR